MKMERSLGIMYLLTVTFFYYVYLFYVRIIKNGRI